MAEPLISTLRLEVISSRRIGSAKVQGPPFSGLSRAISADIERRTSRITGIRHAVRCAEAATAQWREISARVIGSDRACGANLPRNAGILLANSAMTTGRPALQPR